ncbi:uncharacterized protein LOC129612892 [Condylostylus longicornis]|uniref:uncharacterized protein LOC129612892 n=1 Tax=Condylostylus longicornis TaxID=2530218 RepID=UPI00244E1090|nr:uncharacterized protein LOC129612892 [Condylostylus longicornis]
MRLNKKRKTLKINLEIKEEIIISKNFLKRMIEQINLYKDYDLDFKQDNYFTLWAVVERQHENDIKNEKIFNEALKIFNIILEENYFEYYNSKKYHDNEIYLTDLNPLLINRRQSIPERNQELLEVQQYNMDSTSPTPVRRFMAENENYNQNNLNDYTNENLLIDNEHYSPEAFERRKSLGKAQIIFSSDVDIKISKIKKRLQKCNSLN